MLPYKKQGDSFASDSLMFVIREPMIGISPLKDEKKELGRIEGVKSLYTIQSFDEKTAGIEWDFPGYMNMQGNTK